jgi:hypothetical protein
MTTLPRRFLELERQLPDEVLQPSMLAFQAGLTVRLPGPLKRLRCVREKLITPLVILSLADLKIQTTRSRRRGFEALGRTWLWFLRSTCVSPWLPPPCWISHRLLSSGVPCPSGE